MFEHLETLAPDAILRLIAEHQEDSRAQKIDLGVGVYRDEQGNTPVLDTVRDAERVLVEEQTSKTYLGSGGDPVFNRSMESLLFGNSAPQGRVTTVQTPGGSGALRVAAGLILRAGSGTRVWASEPTWANHVPLLAGAGIRLESYPYYDAESCSLRFDAMLDTLKGIPAGDIVLLHGCCHNPTGMDLDAGQWEEVADVVASRGLVPFFDLAYQGFADGVEEDASAVRLFAERAPELIVCSSCSKNFGLYRERVGSLSVISTDTPTAAKVKTQVFNIVRTLYSMPPDHGAAVVGRILSDAGMRKEWLVELAAMRERLAGVRKLLVAALEDTAPGHDFSHLARARGMFSFLGVSAAQVETLKREHAVYMVDSSRINVAGISRENVGYLAESIAAVL